MYYILFLIILLAVFCLIFFHFRKKKIIKKICGMCRKEKCELLNELIYPLGYSYNLYQDIFTSTTDAWQKDFGYTAAFDRLAPFFNMVFDCCPVYFDYAGKTWLIEFWKGQYGINIGAEIGIYHADRLLSPSERKTAIFSAAGPEEYLKTGMKLYHRGALIATREKPHWWLTAFSMGRFAQPKDLVMMISLQFPDFEMRSSFMEALAQAGWQSDSLSPDLYGANITLTFGRSPRPPRLCRRIHCGYVQFVNKIFCKLYCFVTRPFCRTYDKLLYLYFYLPFLFRRMLRLKRFGRHSREKRKI